jgi:hypothetical protein
MQDLENITNINFLVIKHYECPDKQFKKPNGGPLGGLKKEMKKNFSCKIMVLSRN